MDWEEAAAIVRAQMNYRKKEYMPKKDYDIFVNKVLELLSFEGFCKEGLVDDLCKRDYFKSDQWANVERSVMQRQRGLCQDCSGLASEVHHESYDNIAECGEEDDCVALCHKCHKARHGLR